MLNVPSVLKTNKNGAHILCTPSLFVCLFVCFFCFFCFFFISIFYTVHCVSLFTYFCHHSSPFTCIAQVGVALGGAIVVIFAGGHCTPGSIVMKQFIAINFVYGSKLEKYLIPKSYLFLITKKWTNLYDAGTGEFRRTL